MQNLPGVRDGGGKGVTESDVIGYEQLASQNPYPIIYSLVCVQSTDTILVTFGQKHFQNPSLCSSAKGRKGEIPNM